MRKILLIYTTLLLCTSCNIGREPVDLSSQELRTISSFHNIFKGSIQGGKYKDLISFDKREIIEFEFINSPFIKANELQKVADVTFYEFYQVINRVDKVKEVRISFSNGSARNPKVKQEYKETFTYALDELRPPATHPLRNNRRSIFFLEWAYS